MLTLALLLSVALMAQETEPKRPKILGVAHAGFFTSDMENSIKFYTDFLGYDSPIKLESKDGSTDIAMIKINDKQWVEIFSPKPGRKAGNSGQMYHWAIETDDAEAMRLYLKSKGVKVPEKTPKGRTGNSNFFITDPNGVICEIVQYEADGATALNYGKNMPDTRIAPIMRHVGFECPDLDNVLPFYQDILGFTEVWRGGKNPEKVSWVHLKVPDGDQTVELMLFDAAPSVERKGSMNHICLEVPVGTMKTAQATLEARQMPEGLRKPTPIATGINKRVQINYYDILGTRVELMEDGPFDGVAPASSTGKPMKYTPKAQ